MSNNTKMIYLQKSGTFNLCSDKVTDPLFQTQDFFDAYDLLQVKYEMLRRVLTDGWSIAKATQQFGFSRPAFYKMREAFKKGGLIGLFPKKRGPKSPHKITNEIIDFVRKTLEKAPSETPATLVTIIEKQFGFTVHPRTIERAILQKKIIKKTLQSF